MLYYKFCIVCGAILFPFFSYFIQYARYKQFAAEECLLQNGGVMCPTPGCGAGIFPETAYRRVECVRQGDHGCGVSTLGCVVQLVGEADDVSHI